MRLAFSLACKGENAEWIICEAGNMRLAISTKGRIHFIGIEKPWLTEDKGKEELLYEEQE